MAIGTRTGTALFTGLLAAGLAGCGSDGDGKSGDFADQSVEKIKDQVIKDMRDAKSLTLKGSLTSGSSETSLELSSDTERGVLACQHWRSGRHRDCADR